MSTEPLQHFSAGKLFETVIAESTTRRGGRGGAGARSSLRTRSGDPLGPALTASRAPGSERRPARTARTRCCCVSWPRRPSTSHLRGRGLAERRTPTGAPRAGPRLRTLADRGGSPSRTPIGPPYCSPSWCRRPRHRAPPPRSGRRIWTAGWRRPCGSSSPDTGGCRSDVARRRACRRAAPRAAGLLVGVAGVTGVVLGGSRARGDHLPESDVDLGLYYEAGDRPHGTGRPGSSVAGREAQVTRLGAWGPWVDGGAWLTIADVPVDGIYRDLERVRTAWDEARAGRYAFHAQVGIPWACRTSPTRERSRSASCWPTPPAGCVPCATRSRSTRPRSQTLSSRDCGRPTSPSEVPGRRCPAVTPPTWQAACSAARPSVCSRVARQSGSMAGQRAGAVAAAGRLDTAPAVSAARRTPS